MDYIEELRGEHKQILAVFDALDKTKDSEEIRALTVKLLDLIGPHLKSETERLYPAMQGSALEDIRQTAALFSGLMVRYSADILGIVRNIIGQQGQLNTEIIDDFSKIRAKIRDRIMVEETVLFPAYSIK